MSESAKDRWADILMRVAVPLIVGLVSGYLGSSKAIAVLENRVNQLELRQERISNQQTLDGRSLTRIETKVDMILARTSP